MTRYLLRALAPILLILPAIAHAQMDPALMLASAGDGDIALGEGWTQIRGPEELYVFAFDVVVTVLLTALIVYHPVRRKTRRSLADLTMPRLFFLYALIGMSVGFLVVQHGSIIGFVIFGIGALLRFRSNLDDPVDTVEMIIVTVLGLAVGLGLPVMACLVAVVSWGFIWLGGRNSGVEISLKGGTEELSVQAAEQVEAMASEAGWKQVHKHYVPGKARIALLYTTSGRLSESEIETMISQSVPAETDLKITL